MLRCEGDIMISINKLLNTKKDKQELKVYVSSVQNIYTLTTNLRDWLMKVTFTSLGEVETGTTMLDKLAALVDVYTECKFSSPSSIISLRNGINSIGEGTACFIDCVYKNTDQNTTIDSHLLLRHMMHSFDLLMAGSRIILHTLEYEKQQIDLGVDIIDHYYTKQTNPDEKINFVVKFTQPNKITGRTPKEGSKNGSDK